MPPSGRGKGKTRARRGGAGTTTIDAAHEPFDPETPDAVATPSRSSRKRARGAADAPIQPTRNIRRKTKDTRAGVDREDTEGTEAQDASDNETVPALPREQEIIASLKVADRQVNATEDFANDLLEGQENVPGYGKIAGRDWAFIIRKVEVNIGRPEAHERLTVDGEPGHVSATAKTVVDIDLGPDRQVSRSHAVISYDADTASWLILVNGRNGLRVDNNLLRRGTKSYLRNGSVIEIAGTQMAFITSATEDSDGPVWDGSIIRQAQKSSEEDDEGDDETRANGRAHGHPRRGTLHDTASRLPPEYNTQGHNGSQSQTRAHPHSARANNVAATTLPMHPGTPVRPPAIQNPYASKSSPTANYARGITLESTESIDYSSNAAKDLKPPHSYAQLIGMAILSTPEQQMTLSNIYKWIMANYAFYRFNTGGWQNSIRHNLSLNKAFVKIARRTDEPGKGMKWMIEPTEFETFVSQGMKGCRRPPVQVPTQGQQPSASRAPADASTPITRTDVQMTPPLPPHHPSYPTANEAFTPDRGSARAKLLDDNSSGGIRDNSVGAAAETLDFLRSTPRNGLTVAANAAGSPPALFVNDDGRLNGGIDTPFPLKPAQRLAPPSTLRRPSDFIQFSSPAPFWKMEGLVGNTPWKFDISPMKTPFTGFKKVAKVDTDADADADADEHPDDNKAASVDTAKDASDDHGSSSVERGDDVKPAAPHRHPAARLQSPIIQSSSPAGPNFAGGLVAAVADGSPTATRPGSRLAMSSASQTTTTGAKGLSLLAAATREAEKDDSSLHSPSTSVSPDAHPHAQTALQNGFVDGHAGNGYHQHQHQHQHPPPHPQQPLHQQQSALSQPPSQPSQPSQPAQMQSQGHAQGFDDGDDEGIDLVKGFQPIGAFHHNQRSGQFGAAPLGMQPVGVVAAQGRGSFGR